MLSHNQVGETKKTECYKERLNEQSQRTCKSQQ